MKYIHSTQEICIGDIIDAEGCEGLVVCDYDKKECLKDYEEWLFEEKIIDNLGTREKMTGIMVYTKEFGFLQYDEDGFNLTFIKKMIP